MNLAIPFPVVVRIIEAAAAAITAARSLRTTSAVEIEVTNSTDGVIIDATITITEIAAMTTDATAAVVAIETITIIQTAGGVEIVTTAVILMDRIDRMASSINRL